MRRRSIFMTACVLILSGAVWASAGTPLDEQFAAANKDYREGKFKEAAEAYQRIVSAGVASSGLYYNLANSYAKMGQLGKAILFYERALRESPRDPEVRANLEYARSLTPDKTEDVSLAALVEKISPAQWVSWHENVWGFNIFYWTGVLLGIGCILSHWRWKGLLAIASVLLGVALVLGAMLFFRSPLWAKPQAIVMTKEVAVRYGPVLGESTAFTLHEGSKVRVLRSAGDWVQVLYAKGKVGWVTQEALEKV